MIILFKTSSHFPVHVAHRGHVAQRRPALEHQAGGHLRQHGVLRAADADAAVEAAGALLVSASLLAAASRYGRTFLRSWTISCLAYAVFVLGSDVMTPLLGAGGGVGHAVAAVVVAGKYVQDAWLLIGLRQLLGRAMPFADRPWMLAGGVVAASVLVVGVTLPWPTSLQHVARILVSEVVCLAAFLGDPMDALVQAFLTDGVGSPTRYIADGIKGEGLLRRAAESGAEGVLFCAANFCDPALLDQPMLVKAVEWRGVPWTAFKYSENGGQFQVIREQAGTFADSIKLWGGA